MSGYWELNGEELGPATDTTVLVTAHSDKRTVRQGTEAIHGGTEYRERLGKDLVRANITFTILGLGQDKYDVADSIISTLEDDEVWTLQAPDGTNHFIFRNELRAAFSTESVGQTVASRAKLEIPVSAIVNGVWIADGGTYCETITGNFELQSTGPSVYIRDDGTNTGSTPLVRLPEQSSGYPTAVRASDFAEVQVSGPDSTTATVNDDGELVIEEDYDFTGFLIPAPSSAGDVGLYELCSSPSLAALDRSTLLTGTVTGTATMTATALVGHVRSATVTGAGTITATATLFEALETEGAVDIQAEDGQVITVPQ